MPKKFYVPRRYPVPQKVWWQCVNCGNLQCKVEELVVPDGASDDFPCVVCLTRTPHTVTRNPQAAATAPLSQPPAIFAPSTKGGASCIFRLQPRSTPMPMVVPGTAHALQQVYSPVVPPLDGSAVHQTAYGIGGVGIGGGYQTAYGIGGGGGGGYSAYTPMSVVPAAGGVGPGMVYYPTAPPAQFQYQSVPPQ